MRSDVYLNNGGDSDLDAFDSGTGFYHIFSSSKTATTVSLMFPDRNVRW
jgi:hypothetical protein